MPSLSECTFPLDDFDKHRASKYSKVLDERDGVTVTLERTASPRRLEAFVAKRYTIKAGGARELSGRCVERARYEVQMLLIVHPFNQDVVRIYEGKRTVSSGGRSTYHSIVVTQPALHEHFKTLGDVLRQSETSCVPVPELKQLAVKAVRAIEALHGKGICHGDLHSRNMMVRGLPPLRTRAPPHYAGATSAAASTTAARPASARALFAVDGPSAHGVDLLEVELIDFNLSFPYLSMDANPFNSNKYTGKAGAHFLDASIHQRRRFTVFDDLGSLGIVLLECALGYSALKRVTAMPASQISRGATAAAQYACKRMDAFVRALLLQVSSEDNAGTVGERQIIDDLVPKVPECLRKYLAMVGSERVSSSTGELREQRELSVDYGAFCALFK